MQTRGQGILWPHPAPRQASLQNARIVPQPPPFHLLLLCPGSRPSGQPPTPSANLKGNKYKLYKVKGGPTLPWAGPGIGRGTATLPCRPHIIPSCSSVLA